MQQGQVFELKKHAADGSAVWAYRVEHLRRHNGVGSTLTLKELVDEYLAQYEAEPETIDKLCWLLTKALRAFDGRRLPELRSQEIAAWRMTISPGHRFEATQALRQCSHAQSSGE
jgi:hypothetical protein